MITSIEIENLRGIRSGRLVGLTPLTILTGPNACGKSTVLDALLIATSPTPEADLGRSVHRHWVLGGAKWLLGDHESPAKLKIETSDDGTKWHRELKWWENCEDDLRDRLITEGARQPFSTIAFNEDWQDDARGGMTAFSADNKYVYNTTGRGLSQVAAVRLVDPGIPIPLHRTFASAARTGRRDDVYDLLSALVPGFERLEILVEDDDTPVLYITSAGRSVPLGLAGDGVQAFVQLALEIAVVPAGLALVEEPEVYQHPKAIWQAAQVLLANMRRGVQIVLTTHSLELIDALLAEAAGDDLEKLSLFNLLLKEGELTSGHRAGDEIAFARQTLENDLR